MTESTDTITNHRPSDRNSNDNPIDSFVAPIYQHEHAIDVFGLFDDDDDEDSLTLFDLQPIPESHHDLSIFDELENQCDAVLHSTNHQQKPPISTNNNNSYLSNTITTTMINDYERRFQRSLQKLTIPLWYIDTTPSPKISNKTSIKPTSHYSRETHRTPEIVHVHRPRSYRSCRSSLGTSPSPSMHSWHPNHMMDGMNFTSLLPSSSSNSRRHNKYEKGIDRVVKSSHWYQPIQFPTEKEKKKKKKTDSIGTSNLSTSQKEKTIDNHYDIPKSYNDNSDIHLNSIKQSLNLISNISIEKQLNHMIDHIENTNLSKQNNNNTINNSTMKDKQEEYSIKSNEIHIMPLAKEDTSMDHVELEEVTDEEENDKHIPSTVDGQIDDDDTNILLERLASNLVDTILNDILLLKNLNQDDDTNTGVRELSDDENALRELDENDMSGTDEFIVFATKENASDDINLNNNNNNNQTSSSITRGSLNRLYTFSRTNDDNTTTPRTMSFNQDSSSTSELMIHDKDISTTNSLLDTDQTQSVNTLGYLDNDDSNNSFPLYRSHIQKRQINLGRYYDGMMRGTNSQLPTHDLRCNLFTNNTNQQILPSDGVNEETVRKGRILLDSIPNPIEVKNINNQAMPTRSILKNTRYISTDDSNGNITDGRILEIEEKERVSPRKIITTTITEEYRRIQRKVIEEFDEEPHDETYRDSGYSSNQERLNIQQSSIPSVSINDSSPYELLSECYSGHSFMRKKIQTPIKNPLTSNVSSLQSTTDEAYESEVTISPRSPIMNSSSIAYVHPNLEHEFEYPSPPPPVPDRRLKPAHLRPSAPPTKPRSLKQQQQKPKNSNHYNKLKKPSTSPIAVIQHLMATTPNESSTTSARTLSSRHYCGSIPLANEPPTSSSSKSDDISKRNSKSPNNLNSSTNNNQSVTFTKSPSTSLNKFKSKKPSSVYFDEATNGLPIRLPTSETDRSNSTNNKDLNRISTPSSTKRTDVSSKTRPISENLITDRSSTYETSV